MLYRDTDLERDPSEHDCAKHYCAKHCAVLSVTFTFSSPPPLTAQRKNDEVFADSCDRGSGLPVLCECPDVRNTILLKSTVYFSVVNMVNASSTHIAALCVTVIRNTYEMDVSSQDCTGVITVGNVELWRGHGSTNALLTAQSFFERNCIANTKGGLGGLYNIIIAEASQYDSIAVAPHITTWIKLWALYIPQTLCTT